MKALIISLLFIAGGLWAGQLINLAIYMDDEEIWALEQDYRDYCADTNNPPMAKLPWFTSNCTNQIHHAAKRRVAIRKQEMLSQIATVWQTLTPEQQSNVVAALPATP